MMLDVSRFRTSGASSQRPRNLKTNRRGSQDVQRKSVKRTTFIWLHGRLKISDLLHELPLGKFHHHNAAREARNRSRSAVATKEHFLYPLIHIVTRICYALIHHL